MKTLLAIFFSMLSLVPFSTSASAEEERNQYSRSLMLQAPPNYEDPNFKTESQQQSHFCQDLKQQINELKNKPVRRNAAKERYQKECIGN